MKTKPSLLMRKVALSMILGQSTACSSILAHDVGGDDGRVMVYGDAQGVGALFDGINGGNLISKMPPESTTNDNPYAELRRSQDATRRLKFMIQQPVHRGKK